MQAVSNRTQQISENIEPKFKGTFNQTSHLQFCASNDMQKA